MELYNKIHELLDQLEETKKRNNAILDLAKTELQEYVKTCTKSELEKQLNTRLEKAELEKAIAKEINTHYEALKPSLNTQIEGVINVLKGQLEKQMPKIEESLKQDLKEQILNEPLIDNSTKEAILEAMQTSLMGKLEREFEQVHLSALQSGVENALKECMEFVVNKQISTDKQIADVLNKLEIKANEPLETLLKPIVEQAVANADLSFLQPELLERSIQDYLDHNKEFKDQFAQLATAELKNYSKSLATRQFETLAYSLSILEQHALKILQDQSMQLEHQYLSDWQFVLDIRRKMAEDALIKSGVIEERNMNTKAYEVN
ncbi:hypothetical protein [Helicobacter suis]|uniref:hypothetical protein n=1 Tax=Helicobacter suis TaxID=104628 RepID=UPI0013D0080E|nr:hypothetical protein [Helicobacter suis]